MKMPIKLVSSTLVMVALLCSITSASVAVGHVAGTAPRVYTETGVGAMNDGCLAPTAFEGLDSVSIMPRSANITKTGLQIAGTKSYSTSFNMSNLFGDPHNAFNVVISNVSSNAKYTLIIKYDSVEIVNEQYTGSASQTIVNCGDQKFTVMIINDSSSVLKCDLAITSYIKA